MILLNWGLVREILIIGKDRFLLPIQDFITAGCRDLLGANLGVLITGRTCDCSRLFGHEKDEVA